MTGKRRPELRARAVELRLEERLSNREIQVRLGQVPSLPTVASWVRPYPLTEAERATAAARALRRKPSVKKPGCVRCGSPCKSKRNKYCSSECASEHRYEENLRAWLEGRVSGARPTQPDVVTDYVRRYLFEKNSYSCSSCGWSERHPVTNKIPLQIDHIDGNSRNNSPGNLRLLCPNCHALTPTFGALNKGRGRWARRRNPVTKD